MQHRNWHHDFEYSDNLFNKGIGSEEFFHAIEVALPPVVSRAELARLTGANGNSTSLVGTPDQVADAMVDYHRLGIDTFLIRGFDPLADALEYGRDLIPRVRALTSAGAQSHAAE